MTHCGQTLFSHCFLPQLCLLYMLFNLGQLVPGLEAILYCTAVYVSYRAASSGLFGAKVGREKNRKKRVGLLFLIRVGFNR